MLGKQKRIIHLDMDAFYASVEVLDNPALKGKPVIVGGDSSRGVVSAASYEARTFGVRSALPMVTARRLCPNGVFLRPRMSRYQEMSFRIMEIFLQYTPLVEPLSLDEAFLDVTGSGQLFGPAEHVAQAIRQRVKKETGLTVSAGVASCKLVAKIASDLDKPDGLTVVPPGHDREFIAPLAIGKLWGVGKTTQDGLKLLGVQTIGDLSRIPLAILIKKFGDRHGAHLHHASLALDDREVEPAREIKSIGHEDTFARDLVDLNEIRKELLALSVRVAKRLRRHRLTARTVTVKTKYYDFAQTTRSKTLRETTDDSSVLYREGLVLLEQTLAGRKPLRLLGLSTSNLAGAGEPRQADLFGSEARRREREQLNRAVDKITEQFGHKGILPGTLVEEE